MTVLAARLAEVERLRSGAQMDTFKVTGPAEWGRQIRSKSPTFPAKPHEDSSQTP